MEVDLLDDQRFLRETTARFVERESPVPVVRDWAALDRGFDPAWWRRGAELGWTSLLVPEDRGGGSVSGDGLVDLALVAYELGRVVAPGPLVPSNVAASTLAHAVPTPAAEDLLRGVLTGGTTVAWAPPTPGDAPRAEARAGGWRLRGALRPVEDAIDAAAFLVDADTHDGRVVLLVPRDAAGVDVHPLEALDLSRRFAVVTFDDVDLEAATELRTADPSGSSRERRAQHAVVIQLAGIVGAIDRVFELTVDWAFDRIAFGRPLASYQALKHRFADMKTWLEASHATADATARAVAARADDAALVVSVAKAYVADRALELAQDCVQLHGGIGVTWEHDLHLYLRRLTLERALYGTPSEHRLLVADALDAMDAA